MLEAEQREMDEMRALMDAGQCLSVFDVVAIMFVKKCACVRQKGKKPESNTPPDPSPPFSSLTHPPTNTPCTPTGNHTGALAIYQGRYKRFAKNPPPTQQTALAFEVGIY